MTPRKQRVTVTLDPEVVEAGNRAVEAGEADSLSAWVNAALGDRAARQRRLDMLRALIEEHEAEHGVITEEEVEEQRRIDAASAIVIRPRRRPTSR